MYERVVCEDSISKFVNDVRAENNDPSICFYINRAAILLNGSICKGEYVTSI